MPEEIMLILVSNEGASLSNPAGNPEVLLIRLLNGLGEVTCSKIVSSLIEKGRRRRMQRDAVGR